MKLFETDKTLAFLDIGPLSQGHAVNSFLLGGEGHCRFLTL
jgi:hypothetical protein